MYWGDTTTSFTWSATLVMLNMLFVTDMQRLEAALQPVLRARQRRRLGVKVGASSPFKTQ